MKNIVRFIPVILCILTLSSCAVSYYPNGIIPLDDNSPQAEIDTLNEIDNSDFSYDPSEMTLAHDSKEPEETTAEETETDAKTDKETTNKATETTKTETAETKFSDLDLKKLDNLADYFAELDEELKDEERDVEDDDDDVVLDSGADDIEINAFSEADSFYDVPLYPLKQQYVIETAEAFGVSPIMLFGIMKVESNYHETSISSNGKYIGAMQIAKGHLTKLNKYFGITDLQDFNQNVYAGAYYVSYYLSFSKRYNTKYYEGKQDITDMALMCYHRGEGAAAKIWKNKGQFSDSYSIKVRNEMARIVKAGPVSAEYVINKYSLE